MPTLESKCSFWNKTENASLVSDIGPNGTVTGTVNYLPTKFNNGAYTATGASHIDFAGVTFDPDKYIIEMWVKTNGNYVNGEDSSGTSWWAYYYINNNNRIMIWSQATYGVRIYHIRNSTALIFDATNLNWVADSLNHIMFVFDRTGIAGGANIQRVYHNGSLTDSSNVAQNAMVGSGGTFNFLDTPGSADVFKGSEDNIKMYSGYSDQVTIDEVIANRENEGFALEAPTNLEASDGTFTQKVAVTWDSVTDATQYDVYRSLDDVTFSQLSGWQAGITFSDMTAVAGVTYYYNVKAGDGSTESDFSTSDSGWRSIKIIELTCDKVYSQVLILDDEIDIYELGHVDKILKVNEKKTFKKDKLIVNSITQQVKNYTNFYSIDKPTSIFSNIHWRYQPFKIINRDGEVIWNGILQDIECDHRKKIAKIRSVDALYKLFKTKISYTSSDWETPADAFQNICDDYSFTNYNVASVKTSSAKMTTEGALIKCRFDTEDDITLQQAIEKLGEIGCADVYSHKNNVYYVHWQSFTGGVKVSLTESDLRRSPLVTRPDKDLINQYSIKYDDSDGVPVTDSTIGVVSRLDYGVHELREMDCSSETQIVMKNSTTAQYIGECYINRTHKNLTTNPTPLTKIKFELPGTHKEWIDLETYFRLTLSDEGWTNKLFEIYETTIDYDKDNIILTAYEVQE